MGSKDQVSPAKETVASLYQAARAFQFEQPGSPRRAEPFEKLVKNAEAYGERYGDLGIDVKGRALELSGVIVHDDALDGGPFAGVLSGCGVRRLTFGNGIAREELETLAQILARAGQGDEDVVCALWRAGLWAVSVESQDDVDQEDPVTASAVAALAERLDELRTRARTPTADALNAAPPVGRDLVPEAPPPEPSAAEEARSQVLPADDLLRRSLEVTRAGLWRAGSLLSADAAGKLFAELVHRALERQDLALAADILDRADPTEAPALALAAGEKLAQHASLEIVQRLPQLYGKHAQVAGEEIALSLALRVLGHLDSHGVKAAASNYPDVPASQRRPFRRLLSARGGEALDQLIRLADHKALDVAKDGLAILAVIPVEAARKTLEKLAKDPTTPKDRAELVRAAYEHALSLAGRKSDLPTTGKSGTGHHPGGTSSPNKAAIAATLIQNLRDMSQERRLAAARSLAKLGPDPKTFEAVEALVSLPGFPDADEEEQVALLDAIVASGQEKSVKPLELLAERTLGLPTCKLARNALESARKVRR